MSERKFTPGPWHVIKKGNAVGYANYEVAWSDDNELVADVIYEKANAHLIAAAPDLYAACEKVAHLNPDAGEVGEGMLRQIVELARYALLKAEGGNDEQD